MGTHSKYQIQANYHPSSITSKYFSSYTVKLGSSITLVSKQHSTNFLGDMPQFSDSVYNIHAIVLQMRQYLLLN